MFDIGTTELLLIAVVALLVIGPKELPNALRSVGRMTGKARAMTRHLRSGFDEMMRQAELEEMEKQWKEHNRKIMESAPQASDFAFDTPAPAPSTEPPAQTPPAQTPPDEPAPTAQPAPPAEPRP